VDNSIPRGKTCLFGGKKPFRDFAQVFSDMGHERSGNIPGRLSTKKKGKNPKKHY